MSELKPEYKERLLSVILLPHKAELFSETATTITIEDEGGGEFLIVEQTVEPYGKIAINPDEWPAIRKSINRLISQIRKNEKT